VFIEITYLEDIGGRDSLPLVARVMREVDLFVEQRLVMRIAVAKVLQELVSRAHDDAHPLVLGLFVRNLGQVEDYVVDSHVPQQSLVISARALLGGAVR